jgi:hypothetical protein
MKNGNSIDRVVLPFIIVNGIAFLLMISLGKTGEKGLFTFENLFNLTVVSTIAIFAVNSISLSVKMIFGFIKGKKYSLAVGQVGIIAFILFAAGGVAWVLSEAILKNIK